MRQTLEVTDIRGLNDLKLLKPARLAFLSPGRGGPRLFEIRAAVTRLGRARLSATAGHIFADVDPGPSEAPLIALDTIVRSDAAGLERMLFSVIPHVDEIVLGVDARSDEETLKVALRYADCCYSFEAADIGMSAEDWAADKINFAAARNIGRAKVQSPWTLVLDSDEFFERADDLRAIVGSPLCRDTVGCYEPLVVLMDQGTKTFESRDYQRLARTKFRWRAAVHNQLVVTESERPIAVDAVIVSDTSLRRQAERDRREAQRDRCVDDLATDAAAGDLGALFHLAKHKTGTDLAAAVPLAEDFRLRVEVNGPLAWQRQWIAVAVAFAFHRREGNLPEANRWACRALLDGPSVPAFCLLGDVAEDEGDLGRALMWYEAACAVGDRKEMNWPGATEVRWGRRAALRQAVGRVLG